jgi:hypothetical protein
MLRYTRNPEAPSTTTAPAAIGTTGIDPPPPGSPSGPGDGTVPVGVVLTVCDGETDVVGLSGVEGLLVGDFDGGGCDCCRTITRPHIAQFANDVFEPWILQRYVNVPTLVKVCEKDSPRSRQSSNNKPPGHLLLESKDSPCACAELFAVTVCLLSSRFSQRTVSPTKIEIVSGSNRFPGIVTVSVTAPAGITLPSTMAAAASASESFLRITSKI